MEHFWRISSIIRGITPNAEKPSCPCLLKCYKTDGATTDIVERNIEKLKSLFPDVFTGGKVDLDALRETLGH